MVRYCRSSILRRRSRTVRYRLSRASFQHRRSCRTRTCSSGVHHWNFPSGKFSYWTFPTSGRRVPGFAGKSTSTSLRQAPQSRWTSAGHFLLSRIFSNLKPVRLRSLMPRKCGRSGGSGQALDLSHPTVFPLDRRRHIDQHPPARLAQSPGGARPLRFRHETPFGVFQYIYPARPPLCDR